MNNGFHIPVFEKPKRGFIEKLKAYFIQEKCDSFPGYIFFLLATACFSYAVSFYGITVGMLLITIFIAIPATYALVAFPRFGITILLLMAYLLFALMKLEINFPLGTLMDALQVFLVLGLFFYQKQNKNWNIFKGPVTTVLLAWLIYNLLEVANPSAESRLAWVYTIRSVAIVLLTYFIFVYHIKTITFIRLILKIWILLSLIGAIYGLKQEYMGFSAGEEAYLYSDPNIASLLFIDGHWRKFSIFSDPVSFSYNMTVSSLMCIALLSGPIKLWKKIFLIFCILLFIAAMLTSGTRGAYVLIPATLIFFAILKYNKKILVFAIAAGFGIAALIIMPTSNPTLYRFQSAFKPSKDASFNVRAANQKRIQPYILSHPLGGGLGSTGAWGKRFAPNSYLANFPPDSGYVRVAVETGWIGLFLFCLLMFTILKTGINNYYAIKDPELKMYCLAMILVIFAFNLGNYPQEALVQYPSNIYFYLAAALLHITRRIDNAKNNAMLN